MNCHDCISRNNKLLEYCFGNNVDKAIDVLHEYKLKKILLLKICKKYNNDIYKHISSFICHCNECVSGKINDHMFYNCCLYSPKLAKYILHTNNMVYKSSIHNKYTTFDDTMRTITFDNMLSITPFSISLLNDLDLAKSIIYSNFYDESMLSATCCFKEYNSNLSLYEYIFSHPFHIICKKHTWLLSDLITSKKISDKLITNDILSYCMEHNIKSLILLLNTDEFYNKIIHITNNDTNDNYYNIYYNCFLSQIPNSINEDTYFDIEQIINNDLISIEFINKQYWLGYTFLHKIIADGQHKFDEHNNDCNCFSCLYDNHVNSLLIILHKTKKLTKKLLSLKRFGSDTILMLCCSKGYYKSIQTILSFDECDEDILSLQNYYGKNVLMLSLSSSIPSNIKYLLLDSNKITKKILMQTNHYDYSIFGLLNPVCDLYFRYRLNNILLVSSFE